MKKGLTKKALIRQGFRGKSAPFFNENACILRRFSGNLSPKKPFFSDFRRFLSHTKVTAQPSCQGYAPHGANEPFGAIYNNRKHRGAVGYIGTTLCWGMLGGVR